MTGRAEVLAGVTLALVRFSDASRVGSPRCVPAFNCGHSGARLLLAASRRRSTSRVRFCRRLADQLDQPEDHQQEDEEHNDDERGGLSPEGEYQRGEGYRPDAKAPAGALGRAPAWLFSEESLPSLARIGPLTTIAHQPAGIWQPQRIPASGHGTGLRHPFLRLWRERLRLAEGQSARPR